MRDQARLQPFFILCMIFVALLIGMRYRVGADWNSYIEIFKYAGRADLSSVLAAGEDGYMIVNRILWRMGLEIWSVNLVCGIMFTYGLYRFSEWQPDRWLAALVAVPYLIIVVAMGYTRQGVAIAAVLMGLVSLFRTGSILRVSAWIVMASMFHSSALILLPLILLAVRGRAIFAVLVAGVLSYLAYAFFLVETVELYLFRYVTIEQQSSGAMIRVMMNIVPALVFLGARSRMQFPPIENAVWKSFSIASILALVALLLAPKFSTAIDRTALYFIPMQIAVLSRTPRLFRSERFGMMLVVGYCAAVQYVWFNFGRFASYWIPYQIYPL